MAPLRLSRDVSSILHRCGRSYAIIVDPLDYDRHQAWRAANVICDKFLHKNGLRSVDAEDVHLRSNTYGYFIGGSSAPHIQVDVTKSRHPVRSPGFQWSYTGWKADLTAPGILAHEIGHYVDAMLDYPSATRAWGKVARGSKSVSSYEHNKSEAFAETMKLFILNPDLLRHGTRDRWTFMRDELSLLTINSFQWDVVLTHAHARMKNAALAWMTS